MNFIELAEAIMAAETRGDKAAVKRLYQVWQPVETLFQKITQALYL